MTQAESPDFPLSHAVAVADLRDGEPMDVTLRPDPAQSAAIAAYLGALGLSKVRLDARLTYQRDGSVALSGTIGASLTQACVVTFNPVKTRIDEPVERLYRRDIDTPEEDHQMGEDEDGVDPLGTRIDLGAVLVEEIALAMPAFPRAEGAELEERHFTEPGNTPMSDDDAKPFAGLAALRDKLADKS